jgi:hypothetical protein
MFKNKMSMICFCFVIFCFSETKNCFGFDFSRIFCCCCRRKKDKKKRNDDLPISGRFSECRVLHVLSTDGDVNRVEVETDQDSDVMQAGEHIRKDGDEDFERDQSLGKISVLFERENVFITNKDKTFLEIVPSPFKRIDPRNLLHPELLASLISFEGDEPIISFDSSPEAIRIWAQLSNFRDTFQGDDEVRCECLIREHLLHSLLPDQVDSACVMAKLFDFGLALSLLEDFRKMFQFLFELAELCSHHSGREDCEICRDSMKESALRYFLPEQRTESVFEAKLRLLGDFVTLAGRFELFGIVSVLRDVNDDLAKSCWD